MEENIKVIVFDLDGTIYQDFSFFQTVYPLYGGRNR